MGLLVLIALIVVFVCREQSRAEEEILHKRTIKEFVNEVQLLKSCLDEEGLRKYNEKKNQKIAQNPINSVNINQNITNNVGVQPMQKQIVNEVKKERKVIQKETLKNSAILALGSIFIVIAAISFLYTGWDILHNALKIGVLGILAVVFLALSYLAKHKMKLPQTSRAFFYIAMGYIPIVLFSLSLLDLIGEYFSISGDGRFIYMFASSTVIMLLYYVLSIKFKDSKLHVAAHVMQSVVLIFSLLALDVKEEYQGIFFIIHTLLFNIISNKTKLFPKKTKNYGLVQSIMHTLISIPLFIMAIELPVYLTISSIIAMLLYYFLGEKYNNVIFTIGGHVLQSITVFFACVAFDFELKFYVITILLHSVIYNYLVPKFEKNKSVNLDCGKLLFGLYFVISFVYLFWVWGSLTSVLIALLFLINAVVIKTMNENEEWLKIKVLRVFLYFLIVALSFLKIEIAGNVYELPWIAKEIVWTIVIALTSLLYLKAPNSKFSKGGIITNFMALTLISLIPAETAKVLIPANFFTLVGYFLVILNLNVKKENDDFTRISVLIYTLFRFLIVESIVSHIIYAIVCAISWISFEKNGELQKYKLIPFVAYFIKLYVDGMGIFSEHLVVPILLSVSLVILLEILSFVRLKNNESYVIMSLFYTVLPFFMLPEYPNKYILPGILVLWALINLIITIDSLRIFIKLVMSSSLLYIYQNFVTDVFIVNNTALIHLGLIVYLHFITRKLMNKKLSSYKAIEYIGLICIYLTALGNISTAQDGLIYLIMLSILVLFAYSKKCGPLFATTIVAIIIKLFELTQEFWFAIPWWGYLAVIGVCFMRFAMHNEKINQDTKHSLKEKLKTAKEYLDM